jgi:hypothetical protein
MIALCACRSWRAQALCVAGSGGAADGVRHAVITPDGLETKKTKKTVTRPGVVSRNNRNKRCI